MLFCIRHVKLFQFRYVYYSIIYTTKIDGFVCPPNISETLAVRIMKLAHRPPIASTMIKLISKPILLSFLSIRLKIHRMQIRAVEPIHRRLFFPVIRPTPFVSVLWIIWQNNLNYIIFSIYPYSPYIVFSFSFTLLMTRTRKKFQ